MVERKSHKLLAYFLSILFFFCIWELLAKIINAPLILPTVGDVFIKVKEFIKTESFWKNFIYTFSRIIITFVISMFLGTVIGFLCGVSETIKYFFDFPISFIRSTPVVAIILVALFWFNSSSIPIFVGVLMCLPIVVTEITKGFSSFDKNLMFMADVYKLSIYQKIKFIKIPALIPFFLNSAVSSFGLSWKVVVAGEVLSIPKYGFGSLMQISQVHLETSSVIAITLILVFFSFLLEKAFSYLIKVYENHRLKLIGNDINE